MEVGIGLPATIPGVKGDEVLEWARRAENAGFSTLGVIDRIVYSNFEPLITLTAAAAVTSRIRLTTSILIAPYRSNAVLLAKQAASVNAFANGRLVLGMAVGARDDDYTASGVPMAGRGSAFEQQLEEMKRIWAGEDRGYAGAVGPSTGGAPSILIGGSVPAAFKRAAQYGEGWIMGGGPPDQFRNGLAQMTEAWAAAGRKGKPRNAALAYFALGPDARENADRYLHDYYAWLGPWADQIAASAAVSDDMVKQYVAAFADAGCDELILFPSSTDAEQVDLLAAAALNQ